MQLPLSMIARLAGVELIDLSQVDPRGRVDVLASAAIRHIARQLPPEMQSTYEGGRQLIDGLLNKYLGSIRIPDEAMQAAREMAAANRGGNGNGNGNGETGDIGVL